MANSQYNIAAIPIQTETNARLHVRLLLWPGRGGAAVPVGYQRTVRRFAFKNVRHIVTHRKSVKLTKHETLNGDKNTTVREEKSQPVRWLTYLPWAEVKRSSERGAAISLPLPFRARALESAAVASRIMDADRNGAVFTSSASSTASRKPATFRLKQEEGHSSVAVNTESHNVR